jgi:hypothetical protein
MTVILKDISPAVKIKVAAKDIQVGHIVHNGSPLSPLEVLSVEGWTEFGKNTYKISIGRDGEETFSVELPESESLLYTYWINK